MKENNTAHNFIDKLQADANKHERHFFDKEDQTELFLIRPANKWIEIAKSRPIPKMLFDVLWFEGELCILFADTNLGKSILAVQIADSISRGKQVPGFRLEAEKQNVLYFDFELSDKQFEARYSEDYSNHHKFNEHFERAEIYPDADIPKKFSSFEEYLNHSLEKAIIEKGAKILIVDNITYLSAETERAKEALTLMKHLKTLTQNYGLSTLVLGHTPKRDLSKPITKNDISGSKMLINFCDSAFAIGESNQDKSLRYIKQIKVRNSEFKFDKGNVAVCRIDKPINFLRFEFENFGTEDEHLRSISTNEKAQLEKDIVDLKQNEPNLSLGEIAKMLGTNKMKVKRILDRNKP